MIPVQTSHDVGPDLDFLRLLWRVNHGMEHRSQRMLATLGITAPQRMVVRMAGRFPDISAGELAELLHVDRGTLSAALARLERAGVVQRRADSLDRRRVRIRLTPKGEALDRETEGTVESAVARVLAATPPATIRRAREVLASLAVALASEPLPRGGARRRIRPAS